MTHLKQKEAYYYETMETTGCPLIGNRHGGGNADVFPERHAAEYPVGTFSKCRNDDWTAGVDRRQPDLDTGCRRHADHQRYRGDEKLWLW